MESITEKGQDKLPSGPEPLPLLSDYSLKDVLACAKNDFKIGAAITMVYVKLGVSVDKCQRILKEIEGEWRGRVTSMLLSFPSLAPLDPIFL